MCDCHARFAGRGAMGRREFITLATLGAGVALTMATAPSVYAAGHAKALMLSCMDYRLVDDLVTFMNGKGLKDDYDHVVLAGASLGVVSETFADWHKTFWEHLDVAIELHHVEEVVVIDHRDCGAYKIALGEDAVSTPAKETEAHTRSLADFARQVHEHHPDLKVEAYLMSLDGHTEPVAV